jgi:hypothetical protein
MFPYKTVDIYFDDVAVSCRVLRSIRLRDSSFEVLVLVGNKCEYYTCEVR